MAAFITASVRTSNPARISLYGLPVSGVMDLLERGLNVVDWIGLVQDRYRWRALVNSVMNLRVP
jgi:hypothetical protein